MAKRYLYIEMTDAECNSVASLCEMARDCAGVTFAEWAECNPRALAGVARVREAIEYAQTDHAINKRKQVPRG